MKNCTGFIACLLLLLTTPLAQAQLDQPGIINTTYAFTGPCNSQGSWTQAALTQTNKIKEVIASLKDNPACQALKTSMNDSLSNIEQNLATIQRDGGSAAGRIASLPMEITALRNFSRENSAFKKGVMDILFGKTLEYSALSSQVAVNGGGSHPEHTAESMLRLENRVRHASIQGLNMFNTTISSLQQAQAECLDATQGASAISSMVQMLSAFASNGQSHTSPQLAMAVQNLGHFLSRERKYIDALRKLNDREFITSMSCLMEVTSEGYCSALDARYLLQEITNNHRIKVMHIPNKQTGKAEARIVGVSENFAKALKNGPLAGYYILSRQVPIITDWMQKVQFGITPQLPTEANFKNDVAMGVQLHYNARNTIEGAYSMALKLLKDLPDAQSKQTFVFQMIINTANQLVHGNGGTENFFTKVASESEVIFRLLGIPVPTAVLGEGPEAIQFANNPSGWLQAKYRKLPQFSNPEELAVRVQENMRDIFEQATKIAIAYYNKYFIVDKVQVVNDSLLGLDASVRDALINVDVYLKNLSERIIREKQDATILPSINQTRVRIGRVLARYAEIRKMGVELINLHKTDPDFKTLDDANLDRKLRKLGDDLLYEVYEQFEILLARSGWLSNRMATFVLIDYTMSLRTRDQFDRYLEDMMFATGYSALNMMMGIAQFDFSKSMVDIERSLNIYTTNLAALEGVTEQVFTRHIWDLNLKSRNETLTSQDVFRLSKQEAFNRGYEQVPGESANWFQRLIRGKLTQWWMDFTNKDTISYGTPGFWGKLGNPFVAAFNAILGKKGHIVIYPGNTFNSAKTEMSLLCTQALAFPNLRPYWSLCKSSYLLSPLYQVEVQDSDLRGIMDNYLSVNFVKKAYEHIEPTKASITAYDRGLNTEARICALRDYHRRNEVAKITAAMRDDGDVYQNEFTKVVEKTTEFTVSVPNEGSSSEDSADESVEYPDSDN